MHLQFESHKTILSLKTPTVINLTLKWDIQFTLFRINSRTKSSCISQWVKIKISSPKLPGNFSAVPIQRSLIFFQQAVLKQLWQHLHAFFLSCCHFLGKKSDPGIISLPGNTNRQFSLFFPDPEEQLDASHTLVGSEWSSCYGRRRAACLQLSAPFHCDIIKEKKSHVLVLTSSSRCKPNPCLMPGMRHPSRRGQDFLRSLWGDISALLSEVSTRRKLTSIHICDNCHKSCVF